MWCRIFTALLLAHLTSVFLLSVGRSAITDDIFASAVGTMNGCGDHGLFRLSNYFCLYFTTPFPSPPLPIPTPCGVRPGPLTASTSLQRALILLCRSGRLSLPGTCKPTGVISSPCGVRSGPLTASTSLRRAMIKLCKYGSYYSTKAWFKCT